MYNCPISPTAPRGPRAVGRQVESFAASRGSVIAFSHDGMQHDPERSFEMPVPLILMYLGQCANIVRRNFLVTKQ